MNYINTVREAIIQLAEHDQRCGVFDLDDEGKHCECTCGLNKALAALDALEQAMREPVMWLVCSVNSDGSLSLEHAAAWKEAAHEHINDAITEHGIEDAASWVVRPAHVAAPVAQQPLITIEDSLRFRLDCTKERLEAAERECSELRAKLKAQQPQAEAVPDGWYVTERRDGCVKQWPITEQQALGIALRQQAEAVWVNPEIEHMAEEAECVSMCLNDRGVPSKDGSKPLSLWGRVQQYANPRFLEGMTTNTPIISSEHIKALAQVCRLIGNYTTAEFVQNVVGFAQVLLANKAVQEAFVKANTHLLYAAPQQAEAVPSDVVCDKDPQGCWNVRCQLGKVCKNASLAAAPKGQP